MFSRPRTPSTRSIERPCAVCHRRKVRCDKDLPCSQCIRSGFECTYPSAEPPARRVRKTTINDVASRISQMEKTVEAFKAIQASSPQPPASTSSATSTTTRNNTSTSLESKEEFPGPSTGERDGNEGLLLNKGRSSHYVNEVLFSRVIKQEDDVRTALATPRDEPSLDINSPASPFNPMGMLSSGLSALPIASYHPPRRTAIRLWKVFVDSVDPIMKVIHLPTTETILYTVTNDPARATIENIGLCFAIYYASVTTLDSVEAQDIAGEDRNQALHRFRVCLEQSLAQADFLDNPTVTLLQTLTIYSAAMRVHNSGRAVWIMNGIALRAAQSIGLHRDGSKLGLSPFESEIRRRVWWHLLERDGRSAEDNGLLNPSRSGSYGAELPRNLHDSDLFPEMKELPPSRPDWTRMMLSLCTHQALRARVQLCQMNCSVDGLPDEDVRRQIIREAVEKVEGVLEHCNPVIPEQRLTIRISRLILRKVDVVSRRQWQALHQPDDRQSVTTESDVVEATELLEHTNSMWEDDDMAPFKWTAMAFPQYHIMLYILRYLCVCPQGPNAGRALAAVEIHLQNFNLGVNGPLNGIKWTVLTTLRERALSLILMQRSEKETADVQEGLINPQVGL